MLRRISASQPFETSTHGTTPLTWASGNDYISSRRTVCAYGEPPEIFHAAGPILL